MTLKPETLKFFRDENFTLAFRVEKSLIEQFRKDIDVVCELDGTLTIRGIDSNDFRSILTSASLYCYDRESIPSQRQRKYLEALEEFETAEFAEEYENRLMELKEAATEDAMFHISHHALIKTVDELVKGSYAKMKTGYDRMERFYWFLNDPFDIRWKLFRLRQGWKKLCKKMKRQDDD